MRAKASNHWKSKARLGLAVMVPLAALAAACRFSLPEPTATPENPFLPVFASATSIAATSESFVTDTPLPPTPTPRTGPPQACAVPDTSPATPDLSQPNTQAKTLNDYLNAGGSPDALTQFASDQHLLPMKGPVMLKLDLNGDGWLDLAYSLIDPTTSLVQPPGSLYVFLCQHTSYQLVYTSAPVPEHGAPELLAAQDLNGDHLDDLLFDFPNCGAHTCFAQIQVLTWYGGQAQVRLQGQSDDLPSPVIKVEPATSSGGLPRITVTGTGVNSVGAGPYRQRMRTWTWDSAAAAFTPSSEVELPAVYRIHVVYDAEQAAAQGDVADAAQLFKTVINDDQLKDWMDPATERPVLSAYAEFRLVVLYARAGQTDQAQSTFQSLQKDYPAGDLGSAYAQMGQTFWTAFQANGDVNTSCRAAQDFAAAHTDTILQALYFGYANKTYTPSDICPTQP